MGKGKLPKIEIIPTQQDKIVEALSIVGLTVLFLLPLLFYNQLPERIPIHFNAAGDPDGYSGREGVWLLPGIGLVLFILLTAINRSPETFNYPTKITLENAESKYRNAMQMIRWMKLIILVMFIYLTWMMVQVGLGKTESLHSWFVWVFITVIMGTVVYFGFIKK